PSSPAPGAQTPFGHESSQLLPLLPQTPFAPQAPSWQPPAAANRPMREPTPEQPFPPRPSAPRVRGGTKRANPRFPPWILLVGALVLAFLAFALTLFVIWFR